jgi:hypothetical protein
VKRDTATTMMATAGSGARPRTGATLAGSGNGFVGAGRVRGDANPAARRSLGRGGGASG